VTSTLRAQKTAAAAGEFSDNGGPGGGILSRTRSQDLKLVCEQLEDHHLIAVTHVDGIISDPSASRAGPRPCSLCENIDRLR
jgi:hypothetical protein